jgi:hypothetical protein
VDIHVFCLEGRYIQDRFGKTSKTGLFLESVGKRCTVEVFFRIVRDVFIVWRC